MDRFAREQQELRESMVGRTVESVEYEPGEGSDEGVRLVFSDGHSVWILGSWRNDSLGGINLLPGDS